MATAYYSVPPGAPTARRGSGRPADRTGSVPATGAWYWRCTARITATAAWTRTYVRARSLAFRAERVRCWLAGSQGSGTSEEMRVRHRINGTHTVSRHSSSTESVLLERSNTAGRIQFRWIHVATGSGHRACCHASTCRETKRLSETERKSSFTKLAAENDEYN